MDGVSVVFHAELHSGSSRPSHVMLRRVARIAAVLAGIALVLGVGYIVMFALFCCRESPRRAVEMQNATDMSIEVYWVGREDFARELPPGGGMTGGVGEDGCTRLRWVARTRTGDEIDRAPSPFCNGDLWTIVDRRLQAGVRVANETEDSILIEVRRDHPSSVDPGVASLAPGESAELLIVNFETGCMSDELMASTPAAGIIDRKAPPFCAGDTWVITAAGD